MKEATINANSSKADEAYFTFSTSGVKLVTNEASILMHISSTKSCNAVNNKKLCIVLIYHSFIVTIRTAYELFMSH